MIVVECAQGTPEWHQARAGVITASMFSEVRKVVGGLTEQQQKYVDAIRAGKSIAQAKEIAGYRSLPKAAGIEKAIAGEPVGDYSDAAKDYAFRLAVERISGEPLDEGFETWSMRRGRELEEDCRIYHERDIQEFVQLAGFVMTDDEKFGCSADSLISETGGAEYKCFIAPDKLRRIVVDDDWGDIADQVQGCLWITGRKWWDMCLYCPALKNADKHFIRKRVSRNENHIEQLESDLVRFEAMVTEWQSILTTEKLAA